MSMLRKIPEKVIAKLEKIDTPAIIVASCIKVTKDLINNSKLSYLGFRIVDNELMLDEEIILPNPKIGSVSKENLNGKEIVHKDKEKVKKDIYLGERPSFGDWSKGSFSLWQRRDVYQKSFIQPRGYGIKVDVNSYDKEDNSWEVVFTINHTFLRSESNFNNDLLFALSLLNEVTRKYNIYPSDMSAKDIISSRYISWSLFPPGERDIKNALSQRLSKSNNKHKEVVLDRAKVIEELKPQKFIYSTDLSNDYYGALFKDNLVVFENIKYGNATYILYDDWEDISKLSRSEILNTRDDFDRVLHNSNWQKSLADILNHKLGRRSYYY